MFAGDRGDEGSAFGGVFVCDQAEGRNAAAAVARRAVAIENGRNVMRERDARDGRPECREPCGEVQIPLSSIGAVLCLGARGF